MVKKIGIGCLGVVVACVLVVTVLAVWAPWAPEIEVVDPAPGGERVTDGDLLGNYYPAADSEAGPAVLVLGGSEGGLSGIADLMARSLADEGISAMALSYWGGPDQARRMEDLPLERFDEAIAWLGKRPENDPARVGIVGASKGGEAAVLIGSRNPNIAATVGLTPSNVVWQGFDQAQFWRMFLGMGSTWSAGGEPVPYLPYSGDFRGGDLVELYRASWATVDEHPEAVIPVENAAGPMLLVCGEADTLWHACEMSRAIEERAAAHGGEVTLLAYDDAGHFGVGPPVPDDSPHRDMLADLGGSVEGNAAARADSWPQVVAFLRAQLG
ncbi:MAG: acyl-CoA thioester hydrolase/BAAT C-terminal domain-containing protein [Mobilicoccus sp.]|nr:acyl-CoA thioester hydrolase/BAAT C-terminal domain-containing protein [Mobilicoccus sp.]